MRNIVIFAAAVLILGSYAARFADREVKLQTPRAAAVQTETQPESSGRSLTLESDRQGHFHVEARIDGARLGFMVDTGASQVVLRESDAAEAGIRPLPADFTTTVSTANGKIKAAAAKIDRIDVNGISVYEVPALVLPDAALAQNLLGVSFLSKLKRYEYADGRLVLEQ
jgi:aspartyl protease family protein